MPLPQTLAENERGVAVYKDSEFLGYEDIIIISDEQLASQLYQEQLERDSNDAIHDIKYKLDNWDDLTSNQQKAVVRSLLTCMLKLYQGQY